MPAQSAADIPLDPLGLPAPGSRRLLPYERRLVAWHVRRWQTSRKYDVVRMADNSGPEFVRLLAAHVASRKLMSLTGFLAVAVTILYAAAVSDGWGAVVAGLGALAVSWAIGLIGLVRMFQSGKARKDYQQARRLTTQ